MPEYTDIETAIDYVSSAPRYTNQAVYDKRTAQFFYASELSGENDIPDDLDWDQCIEIPHKHELNLGRNLVFRFILQYLPDEEDVVRRIFKRRGAYGRFKDFLDHRKMLQPWYDFEATATRKAIERWCKDNGMEIGQQGGSPNSSWIPEQAP
jgi:hypothetical protein